MNCSDIIKKLYACASEKHKTNVVKWVYQKKAVLEYRLQIFADLPGNWPVR